MHTITCQTCGDPYDISHLKGKDKRNRLFCGKKCSARFTNVVYPRRSTTTIMTARADDGKYLACIECTSDISAKPHQAFCNTTCRTSFWSRVDEEKPPSYKNRNNRCPHCDKEIGNSSKTCQGCAYVDRIQEKIDLWLSGEWSGATPGNEYQLAKGVRRYLLEEAQYSCTSCGFNTPHPSGASVLQIDHIDGHSNNHARDNLRVLCPNCHALTETYGARNKGNGRPLKMINYYKSG